MYPYTGNKPYFGFLKDFVCLLILTGKTYEIIAILMLQKMPGQWEECYTLNVCVFKFLTNLFNCISDQGCSCPICQAEYEVSD